MGAPRVSLHMVPVIAQLFLRTGAWFDLMYVGLTFSRRSMSTAFGPTVSNLRFSSSVFRSHTRNSAIFFPASGIMYSLQSLGHFSIAKLNLLAFQLREKIFNNLFLPSGNVWKFLVKFSDTHTIVEVAIENGDHRAELSELLPVWLFSH